MLGSCLAMGPILICRMRRYYMGLPVFFSGRYIVASPATAADVDANSIAIRGAGVFGEEKRCMHRRGWTKGKTNRYCLTASRVHPVVMGKVLRQTACRIERVDRVYLCGR